MKTYTVKGYWRGELQVEECSIDEDEVQTVVDELESEGYTTEVEES
jgi:competence protein ComGC